MMLKKRKRDKAVWCKDYGREGNEIGRCVLWLDSVENKERGKGVHQQPRSLLMKVLVSLLVITSKELLEERVLFP